MAEVFVPLNRFRSVISKLTGEEDEVYVTPLGISTIILSAQITNNTNGTEKLTISVDSNRELAVPNFDGVNSTGSFVSASALLELNKTFIHEDALYEDIDITDELYDERPNIVDGMITIGNGGCSFSELIVIKGTHSGSIWYCDGEACRKTHATFIDYITKDMQKN